MRKLYVVGLVFVAVFAFFAMDAVAAFAEPAEWLVGGNAIEGTFSAETEGLIELVRLKSPTNSELLTKIDCEGILDGTITQVIGVKGAGTITAILNLAQELVNELGEPTVVKLSCTVMLAAELGDCPLNTLVELTPDNLYNPNGPWLTLLLELETGPLALDELFTLRTLLTEPGYEILCEAIGLTFEELCIGPTELNLTNDAGTTPVSVLVGANDVETPEIECTLETNVAEPTNWEEGAGTLEGSPNLWVAELAELTDRLSTAIS